MPPTHHSGLSLPGLPPPPTGSLEALRAHAHTAANMHSPLQLQPSPHSKHLFEILVQKGLYFPIYLINRLDRFECGVWMGNASFSMVLVLGKQYSLDCLCVV